MALHIEKVSRIFLVSLNDLALLSLKLESQVDEAKNNPECGRS